MSTRRILVTGAAGFIGFHTAQRLAIQGDTVIGIDNFNDYYDPVLKKARAALLREKQIVIHEADIAAPTVVHELLEKESITHVIHLAAQAGVRYSLKKPQAYVRANIDGFLEVVEAVRRFPHVPLVYASSSSVYGLNKKVPFAVTDSTDAQANFYGVTKKANELTAATYHHLYNISCVGLRFFTVYGPWGRPDMAYYFFTQYIQEGRTIDLYNFGNMKRDFTYIDDIVDGVVRALDVIPGNYIFNLGNEKPESLLQLVEIIERYIGKKAVTRLLPMPLGEIEATFADIKESKEKLQFFPKTSLEEGMKKFLDWYQYDRKWSASSTT